jgi:hypothetical protein
MRSTRSYRIYWKTILDSKSNKILYLLIMVQVQSNNFWESFLIGGITGAMAQTINAPLERIKLLL